MYGGVGWWVVHATNSLNSPPTTINGTVTYRPVCCSFCGHDHENGAPQNWSQVYIKMCVYLYKYFAWHKQRCCWFIEDVLAVVNGNQIGKGCSLVAVYVTPLGQQKQNTAHGKWVLAGCRYAVNHTYWVLNAASFA